MCEGEGVILVGLIHMCMYLCDPVTPLDLGLPTPVSSDESPV